MKRWNVVVLGIVALTVIAITGCPLPPQPPTGVYQAAAGWMGNHSLLTDGEGTISGSISFAPVPYFPATCLDAEYTIVGAKGPTQWNDEEVQYMATATVIPEDCEGLLTHYCFFLDDSSEDSDWTSMDGKYCDCTAFPYVLDCVAVPEGGLVLLEAVDEAPAPE